ncbi:MAG: hypothetical protein NVS4B12_26450 [Ktedonobacteraceae bacterium]
MARRSLYICGALALLIVLYCILAVHPLPAIPVAVGSIFSITAFWPHVRYGLQFAKSNIKAAWRMLLRQPDPLEVVLVDPRKDPFKEHM